jgi:hypothetical protein
MPVPTEFESYERVLGREAGGSLRRARQRELARRAIRPRAAEEAMPAGSGGATEAGAFSESHQAGELAGFRPIQVEVHEAAARGPEENAYVSRAVKQCADVGLI